MDHSYDSDNESFASNGSVFSEVSHASSASETRLDDILPGRLVLATFGTVSNPLNLTIVSGIGDDQLFALTGPVIQNNWAVLWSSIVHTLFPPIGQMTIPYSVLEGISAPNPVYDKRLVYWNAALGYNPLQPPSTREPTAIEDVEETDDEDNTMNRYKDCVD